MSAITRAYGEFVGCIRRKYKANFGLLTTPKGVERRQKKSDIRNTSLEIVIKVFGFAVVAVVDFSVFGFCVYFDSLDSLGFFCVAVDRNDNTIDFHIAGRNLEWVRHLGRWGISTGCGACLRIPWRQHWTLHDAGLDSRLRPGICQIRQFGGGRGVCERR